METIERQERKQIDKIKGNWWVRLTRKHKRWWEDIIWSYRQQGLLNGLIVKSEKKTWVKDDSRASANKWMVIPLTELEKRVWVEWKSRVLFWTVQYDMPDIQIELFSRSWIYKKIIVRDISFGCIMRQDESPGEWDTLGTNFYKDFRSKTWSKPCQML